MSTPAIACTPVLYGEHLHGFYCAPDTPPSGAVLLVPPLFEEKRCAHRALGTCARALAQAGVAVLHIDLYGTGNSHGALTEIGVEQWLTNIAQAAAYLHARCATPLTLLGCRAGALLAAQTWRRGLSADRCLLWQPVVAGRGYLGQLRTRRMIQNKLTGDTPPEIGDYEVEGESLSPELFAELQALQLPDTLPDAVAVRLIQYSFNEKLLNEYARLLTSWDAERVPVRRLIGEPFWRPHSPGDYQELAQAIVAEVTA